MQITDPQEIANPLVLTLACLAIAGLCTLAICLGSYWAKILVVLLVGIIGGVAGGWVVATNPLLAKLYGEKQSNALSIQTLGNPEEIHCPLSLTPSPQNAVWLISAPWSLLAWPTTTWIISCPWPSVQDPSLSPQSPLWLPGHARSSSKKHTDTPANVEKTSLKLGPEILNNALFVC